MQEQEYLILSTVTETVLLREEQIVCITADGNYSHICAVGGETFIVSSQLGQIEQSIGEQLHSSYGYFIRIGRGLIINMRYLCYINITKHKLCHLDTFGKTYVQGALREALVQLKGITDKRNGNG